MSFPKIRMRRLRKSNAMRRLLRETSFSADDLVYPLFVKQGKGLKEPIKSMTGCFHFSPDTVVDEAAEVAALGIPAVLIFGLPAKKDKTGSEAWAEYGAAQQAVREIKKAAPDLLVITDVCLCAYTDHGHCGIIKDGKVDNDAIPKKDKIAAPVMVQQNPDKPTRASRPDMPAIIDEIIILIFCTFISCSKSSVQAG